MNNWIENVVIGSGPGGAVSAACLAEAGREVTILEEGDWYDQGSFVPFSREEMIKAYRARGVSVALGRPQVAIVEGACAGGGSEVNSGLYHRLPPEVSEEWRIQFRVREFEKGALESHFEQCERDLSVCHSPEPHPRASLILKEGADALGWSSMEVPRWFKYAARGARTSSEKQSMTRTYLPRAKAAGADILTRVRARRLARMNGGWRIRTVGQKTGPSSVKARNVFVACGAVQTAALLRRSGFRKNVGNSLFLQPMLKVVAEFPEVVNRPGLGVAMHQVKEFWPRYTFGCSVSTPPHLAVHMANFPDAIAALPNRWPHWAAYYVSTFGGKGRIRNLPGSRIPLVSYKLSDLEMEEISDGVRDLCRCLFAAGAEKLYLGVDGLPPITPDDWEKALPDCFRRSDILLTSVHMSSSCPMGENPAVCAVDSYGQLHGEKGLYVSDASILCSAPKVNPQGSVVAMALRNTAHFLQTN